MKKDRVILVAEDDTGHFQLIKKNLWLTCVDSDIIQFKNGQEVLDFLFKMDTNAAYEDTKRYTLLLDIRMPKVDGMEVLRKIKEDEKLRIIPVIMLTTTGETNMIKQCYELGCSFYMVKPVDYNYFMKAVQNLGKYLSLESLRLPFIKSSCD